jgi:hypothetical protein
MLMPFPWADIQMLGRLSRLVEERLVGNPRMAADALSRTDMLAIQMPSFRSCDEDEQAVGIHPLLARGGADAAWLGPSFEWYGSRQATPSEPLHNALVRVPPAISPPLPTTPPPAVTFPNLWTSPFSNSQVMGTATSPEP